MIKPIDTTRGLQVADAEGSSTELAVVAALGQTLTGLRVGLSSLQVHCSGCGTRVSAGERLSVCAYRPVETPRWQLVRPRCAACAPADILTPTVGTTEVRADARLVVVSDMTARQYRLYLADPTVTAVSPPADGTP